MLATIILSILIGAIVIWNIYRMIRNLKEGKCTCGCGGNCTGCSGNCAGSSNCAGYGDRERK